MGSTVTGLLYDAKLYYLVVAFSIVVQLGSLPLFLLARKASV
jgi:hypothetical protein